jgi:prevent-host-death family protein
VLEFVWTLVQNGITMLRTATVTELRSKLSSYLESLREGPLLVLSHSKPAAMLVEPEEFDRILERVEYLEDLLDGRQAVAEYLEDPGVALDAEEVFERLGR